MIFRNSLFALGLAGLLAACGTDTNPGTNGSASAGSATAVSISQSGNGSFDSLLSLRVTDAPINDIARVMVTFTGVRLRSVDDGWVEYDLDSPMQVDLLELQGTTSESLLANVPAIAGAYNEVRLFVDDDPSATFIELKAGGVAELKVPSGSSSGLKLKGDFVISSVVPTSLTIDFDLRKSIVKAGGSGKYNLKPVIRLLNNDQVGHVRGVIANPLLLVAASCSDLDVDSHNAAYIYRGHITSPADINDDDDSDDNGGPLTTTSIQYDAETDTYFYEAAYLPAGDYTVAITCNANLDELESSEDLKFFNIQPITVLVNNTLFL